MQMNLHTSTRVIYEGDPLFINFDFPPGNKNSFKVDRLRSRKIESKNLIHEIKPVSLVISYRKYLRVHGYEGRGYRRINESSRYTT